MLLDVAGNSPERGSGGGAEVFWFFFSKKNVFLILPMRAYPIFLDLQGRRVVVLGSNEAADRRAETFGSLGAIVERVATAAEANLVGCALACASGAPEAELAAFSAAAQRLGIPVNVVDRPELCSFSTPAIVDRDPLTIAISSGGAAPVLSRLLRARIETFVAPAWGRLARLADGLKAETRRRLPDVVRRRRMLEQAFAGQVADLVFAGDEAAADSLYRQQLSDAEAGSERTSQGMVYLVGAGPGAPDLLSLRGLRLLGEADVIVHDRLGTAEVLELARRDAERIDVGKSQGDHTMPQRDINALLVRLAQEGRRVVRLKGGDPFIFGRGGEEVEALVEAGVAHEVVPGITAALACAASARIPLTHRAAAHAVTFVTAHRRRPDLGIDYAGLLRPGVTLAIYMGLATLPKLRDELEAAGYSTRMAAVLIENGGTAKTRVLRGTVEELATRAGAWATGGPALILIGGTAEHDITRN
jgi:uroporphyrin-III C-methyltransferase/precorrin-2 dehydrogenase/sirohydrochlorin ferrochelatase